MQICAGIEAIGLLESYQESEVGENGMTLQPCTYLNLDLNLNERLRQRTILLVEDEPFVREQLAAFWRARALRFYRLGMRARR